MPKDKKKYYCSFCGKEESQVERLIQSQEEEDVFICNECIEESEQLLESFREYDEFENRHKEITLLKPVQIKAKLDEYIIGQERAKKVLSVAVYNHFKRITHKQNKSVDDDVELQKSNVLLVGPTGSGKTLLAQTLAKTLNVPLAIADATTLTEAGYVGDDVENVLLKLIKAADYDIEAAEHGIIYIDEIDKIASKEGSGGRGEVSREGVQRDILPIVEGATVKTKYGSIKTDHILFIAAGAFHVSKPSNLIPELQGRFPIRVELHSLSVDDLRKILTEPRQALIRQYTALLEADGVQVTFSEDALVAIAEIANEVNSETEDIGARRLYTILERVLEQLSYDVPELPISSVVIDEAYVRKKLGRITENMDISNYIL